MPERFDKFCEILMSYKDVYNHIYAWNTEDFIVQWVWDLIIGKIHDDVFFQIGDVTSDRLLKQSRPHLQACSTIETEMHEKTLYVIDAAAKVSYEYAGNSLDTLQKKLHLKNSAIVVIDTV